MTILTIRHTTLYRYAKRVRFGDHRLMFRPRDSHDLRLLDTALRISPTASVRWLHDVFGNSIAIATFEEGGTELLFESTIRAKQFPVEPQQIVLEPYAERYPWSYSAEEIPDLGRTIERSAPDPDHDIDAWARTFVSEPDNTDTMDILMRMTRAIKEEFGYARREEPGTQGPVETLLTKKGSCRDFAMLMIEACRSLGFAARFVSGYLFDQALVGGSGGMVGGGATHAWVQVYLPGAGWVEFDPTNALIGGRNLVRVAVARMPSQALPLSGSFIGEKTDFEGMSVSVSITVD